MAHIYDVPGISCDRARSRSSPSWPGSTAWNASWSTSPHGRWRSMAPPPSTRCGRRSTTPATRSRRPLTPPLSPATTVRRCQRCKGGVATAHARVRCAHGHRRRGDRVGAHDDVIEATGGAARTTSSPTSRRSTRTSVPFAARAVLAYRDGQRIEGSCCNPMDRAKIPRPDPRAAPIHNTP